MLSTRSGYCGWPAFTALLVGISLQFSRKQAADDAFVTSHRSHPTAQPAAAAAQLAFLFTRLLSRWPI